MAATTEKFTLELTKEERDLMRDFFACFWSEYEKQPTDVGNELYNKVDRLDMEEVNAS